MAKTSIKTKKIAEPKTEQVLKASATKPSTRNSKKGIGIEEACEMALNKLRELDIEHALQADLQWCLGSYRADGNPIGLFQMLDRAVAVFKREKTAKTPGINTKLISDLSKALNS